MNTKLAPLRLVIYDLDGTLINSLPELCRTLNAMLQGFAKAPTSEDEVRNWIGNGSYKLVERALQARDLTTSELTQAHHNFLQCYRQQLNQPSLVYPGVTALLTRLKKAGISQAIATNKPQQFVPTLLRQIGIAQSIDAIVGGNTYTDKKPSALPLTQLLKRFHCSPQNALMIGDSRSDAGSAEAAGIECWLLEQGYAQGENLHALGAAAVFSDIESLAPSLLQRALTPALQAS